MKTESRAKHTAGNWKVFDSETRGLCIVTEEYTSDICRLEMLIPREESEANAKLIAEAGTVASETGLTPRQLLAHRNELLEALEIVWKAYGFKLLEDQLGENIFKVEQAINNPTT